MHPELVAFPLPGDYARLFARSEVLAEHVDLLETRQGAAAAPAPAL